MSTTGGAAEGRLAKGIGLVLLLVLGVVLLHATAERVDARMVGWGEELWPGYGGGLRQDPTPPLCDRARAAEMLSGCVDVPAATSPAGDDPFADPVVDDPFADPPSTPPVADDPFAAAPATPAVSCTAARQLVDQCEADWQRHEDRLAAITPTVRAFRAVDRLLLSLVEFAYGRHLLSLVLLIGGLQATWLRTHIRLGDPRRLGDHRVAQGAELLANLILLASCVADWQVQASLDIGAEEAGLPLLWALSFGSLAAVNLFHLLRPPPGLAQGIGLGGALTSIPLYAWMAIASGLWFHLGEHHPSGQAIYLHRFAQFPGIYLSVALYIWTGMLLERTGLARRIFDLLRPWSLPVPLLGWVVMVGAALPTAYSGASGIFVIAAGAVVFEEMRRAGASRTQALMVTAMSGSLGVVLRPCLIVVLVAALNKQVTTDQLYANGAKVFVLTSTLFLLAMLLLYKRAWKRPDTSEALSAMGRAGKALLPDLLVIGLVVAACAFFLDAPLNERTAPWILPIAILLVLAREGKPVAKAAVATRITGTHLGALLFLMAATVSLGGVIERAELMSLAPAAFSSPFAAMSVLVVAMVLVGMTMDPMGAVVLVSVTLADLAYKSGIDPVHFWMMVLVAFELGYLTPPVALNQLLARQVVGAEAEPQPGEVLAIGWRRYEHVVVPVGVMGVALLLVAFVPLLWG